MALLLPVFLGAMGLVGLPLFLHLLRVQPRQRVPFPSLVFLGRAALHDTRRQSLRRWLTLLLRCLLISLVVLAFCRPSWRTTRTHPSRAVVVVVDNSYSMQAVGRRQTVEAWLAPQLASLRAPDQLGVLLLHPAPTWLVPLTDNLDLGRDALHSLPQAYETSHYRAGIELAGAKLALSPLQQKQILLAADQQRTGWNGVRFERPLPPGVKLYPAPPAPAPKRQAAVTALRVKRLPEARIHLAATVRSYAPDESERIITFYAEGVPLGQERVALIAGRAVSVGAEYPAPRPGGALMLHATLDADDLPVDDTAYAALVAADDQRVFLSAAPSGSLDFLGLALASMRAGQLPALRVDPPPGPGVPWAPSSVAVLRGPAPFRGSAVAQLEAFLAAGGSAWILGDGSAEQTAWLAGRGVALSPVRPAENGKLKLRDFALEHPLFEPFARYSVAPLLTPVFHRGWALQGEFVEPLARWPDRSIAIAEIPTGDGRVLVTGFDESRASSTFPAEAGFVPLVHQAITWLAQNPMAAPIGCRVGATLLLPGAGTWRAVLTPRPVSTAEVNGYVTPTVPGLYAFEQPSSPRRYYAVNLDPAESDLTPWPTPTDFARLVAPDPPAAVSAPSPTQAPAASPNAPAAPLGDPALIDELQAWWWLLAAATVVLLLELTLANRTVA